MLRQILTITVLNLRSIPQRVASSIVVVIGVAGVVGVLVAVLAMAGGLASALGDAGSPARAIVLHKAAQTEGFSNIEVGWVGTIADAPGVLRARTSSPAVVAERIVGANLHRRADGMEAGITLRGTGEATFRVHPEWRLTAGRMFRPGLRELVIGTAAAAEFAGVELGDHVRFGTSDWTVVGRFSSHGDSHDSEALTDARTLMSAFGWGEFSSVTARLESPAAFDSFRRALLANPSLEIDVQREQDYYRSQSKGTAGLLFLVSTVVGTIMAIGAVFTALNTLYQAVATRSTEIATLRAIGFGPAGVVSSVLVESLLLCVLGALLGAGIAWLLFNGDTLSTNDGAIDSQVNFRLLVGPRLVGIGIMWACAIALIGGLLPAVRAARLPVAVALRPA